MDKDIKLILEKLSKIEIEVDKISNIDKDIQALKSDVNTMKSDIKAMRLELAEVKESVDHMCGQFSNADITRKKPIKKQHA